MHEVPLLINITMALVVAFIGGVTARKIGLPTIVGYLLAGIAIGPFTPGFVGDTNTIQQLAELGIIFLMFGVGLHFSFTDLWRVRDTAIPGTLIQMFIVTFLGFGLCNYWEWSVSAGIIFGLAISIASTVVLLRGLMDHSLLNTPHGQIAVGWVVMQDILSVILLVLMPTLTAGSEAFDWWEISFTIIKSMAFIVVMFFAGKRIIPWLLERIAHTRSRELFILTVLAITLGTAMGASEFFGVSLALGAFVAGTIISQSHLSHQIGADIFSFREAFSVLFFVSVGMLVNPSFLWQNLGQVISLTLLIVVGKAIIVILVGLVFPQPMRSFLIVAVGLSQIGEFSFILGQEGLSLNLLNADQYSLILVGSLFSITINPFIYRLLPYLEKYFGKLPLVQKKMDGSRHIQENKNEQIVEHVVIVGYGRVGKHLVDVLESLAIPLLVIESDDERRKILSQKHIPTLFGDPGNSEVIVHAYLERARALVVTVPDETVTAVIVASAHDINPYMTVIARAATVQGVQELTKFGAHHVVHPELEGGLEMVHHTLLSLGFPLREVHQYIEAVRRDSYDTNIITNDEYQSLHDLLHAIDGIEITWMKIVDNSPIIGKTLGETNIRSLTGASVVALIRNGRLIANPKSMTIFEADDRIGIIGEPEQVENAQNLMNG